MIFCFSPCMISLSHNKNTFVQGWRNALCWLVDLLGVDLRQVVSLMKNKQQSQNLLLKVDPRCTFHKNFLQPTTNAFVAQQVDHTRWKTWNVDLKLTTKQCSATSWGFLYLIFQRLKENLDASWIIEETRLFYYPWNYIQQPHINHWNWIWVLSESAPPPGDTEN